jgi:hypothetical protein
MLNVAAEISQLVHSIGDMETVGVKIASAEGSAITQHTNSYASSALYNVIVKCAEDFVPGEMPHHARMVSFIDKTASVLNKPVFSQAYMRKLAAAVVADDALTDVISITSDDGERVKLAEAQAFGREFIMEILRGVI